MTKHVIAIAVAGTMAGAALVGVPTMALATEAEEPTSRTAEAGSMSSMMSDPELREQMTSHMSRMMSDPETRRQMQSMMPGAMGGMGGMDLVGSGMSGDPQH